MNVDVYDYNYKTVYSPEDKCFVSTVDEFPSLAAHDEDPQRAWDGIVSLVIDVIKDLEDNGEPVPAPLRPFHVEIGPADKSVLTMTSSSGRKDFRIGNDLTLSVSVELAESVAKETGLQPDQVQRVFAATSAYLKKIVGGVA